MSPSEEQRLQQLRKQVPYMDDAWLCEALSLLQTYPAGKYRDEATRICRAARDALHGRLADRYLLGEDDPAPAPAWGNAPRLGS